MDKKRRSFLKYSAVTPFIASEIGQAIAMGFISKAHAQENRIRPRNLFTMWVQGGVWASGFDYMPGIFNGIGDGSKMNGRNATIFNQITAGGEVRTNAVKVPLRVGGKIVSGNVNPIWDMSVRLGNGSEVKLSELMNGMVIFQGVRCPLDGHGIVDPFHFRPAANPSLHGALAAMARRVGTPLKAEAPVYSAIGSPPGFMDPEGLGSLAAQELKDLLLPLKRNPKDINQANQYLSRRQAMEVSMNSALETLGKYYAKRLPGSEGLFKARAQADMFLKRNFDPVMEYYDQALVRYRNVANGSIDAYRRNKMWVVPEDRGRTVASSAYSRNYFAYPLNGTAPGPLHGSIDNVMAPDVSSDANPRAFAMAETLFVHGLSSVFHALIGGGFSMTQGGQSRNHAGDLHFSGLIATLIGTLSFQVQFAAMVSELKRVLSEKNLWTETVVQWTGEFNRSPRADLSGADHGWEAHVTSVYSGAIEGFSSVGNVMAESNGAGTWGKNASVVFQGEFGGSENRPMRLEDVTSTLGQLTRLPRTEWPDPRGYSVLDPIGNDRFQASPRVEATRIVKG